jgi:rhamnosyltransferase
MDVSIIILTKNGGENVRRLLLRISSQRFVGEYEILVIDSGSRDSTVATARESVARVVEIKPEEFHHGRTRNLGADLTTGRVLVYITQDALPLDDHWLQNLTAPLVDPSVAMVVGRQIAWETTKPPEKFFYLYSFPEQRIEVKVGADYVRDNIFISDVNSALRRDVWERFRFSEKILQAEDKELATRLLQAGWTILYEPSAAVYHAHDFTLRSLWRRSVDIGKSLAQGAGLPRSRFWLLGRLGYYISETGYIMGCRRWYKWLPYSIVYESHRLAGVCVGWARQMATD